MNYLNNGVVGGSERLHVADDPGIFASPSSLLPVPVVKVDLPVERLSEGDLGLSHDHGAIVLTSHPLGVDLKVEFTHPRSYGLLDIVIKPDSA